MAVTVELDSLWSLVMVFFVPVIKFRVAVATYTLVIIRRAHRPRHEVILRKAEARRYCIFLVVGRANPFRISRHRSNYIRLQ